MGLPTLTFRVMLTAFRYAMPDRAFTVTIDPELQPGARNAIRDCLRLLDVVQYQQPAAMLLQPRAYRRHDHLLRRILLEA